MLAAIYASDLSAHARLVSLFLPLLAELKDNCLGSPPPSRYHCLGCWCDVSTNRLGQLCYRQALWPFLRLQYFREGVHLAAHLCERREKQREETWQTGSGPLPLARCAWKPSEEESFTSHMLVASYSSCCSTTDFFARVEAPCVQVTHKSP